jgi:hypothetical protein
MQKDFHNKSYFHKFSFKIKYLAKLKIPRSIRVVCSVTRWLNTVSSISYNLSFDEEFKDKELDRIVGTIQFNNVSTSPLPQNNEMALNLPGSDIPELPSPEAPCRPITCASSSKPKRFESID